MSKQTDLVSISQDGDVLGPLTTTGAVTPASMNWSAAKRTKNDSQSLPNNIYTIIAYDDLVYDTLSELDSTGRFTATVGGTYSASASLATNSAAWSVGGQIVIAIFKNGVIESQGGWWISATASSVITAVTVTSDVILAATDYIDIRIYHNQGGAITTRPHRNEMPFSVHRTS